MIFLGCLILLLLQQDGKLSWGKTKGKLLPVERNVFNLELGDIVQYEGIDWFVEGKLIYNTGSYTWFEYMLQEGNNVRWLSVEEDDFLEVAIFETIDSLPIKHWPPKKLTYLEQEYNLAESGTAKMMRLGNTLNRQAQTCHYFDYTNSNDLCLSVEKWEEEIEVSVGKKVNPRMLSLLPGDGKKVYN